MNPLEIFVLPIWPLLERMLQAAEHIKMLNQGFVQNGAVRGFEGLPFTFFQERVRVEYSHSIMSVCLDELLRSSDVAQTFDNSLSNVLLISACDR